MTGGAIPLTLIAISIIGFARRPSRMTGFLLLSVVANLAVLVFASQSEPRLSYPVLPIHMLLGLGAVFALPGASGEPATGESDGRPAVSRGFLALAAVGLAIALFACWAIVGRQNLYRPLMERAMIRSDSAVAEHRARGSAYRDVNLRTVTPQAVPMPGELVRIRCRATNYMLPPKSAGAVDYLPAYASDPSREQYFYARAVRGGNQVGITYFGAVTADVIREYDVIVVEGRVVPGKPVKLLDLLFWIKAEAVYKQENRRNGER